MFLLVTFVLPFGWVSSMSAQNSTVFQVNSGSQVRAIEVIHKGPTTAVDSDMNGLPDAWELLYFGRIGVDPGADQDGDGLVNILEWQHGTNPTMEDSDSDGVSDGQEIALGSDPMKPGPVAVGQTTWLTRFHYSGNPPMPSGSGPWTTEAPFAFLGDSPVGPYSTSAEFHLLVPPGATGVVRWLEVFYPQWEFDSEQYTVREWSITAEKSPPFILNAPADGSVEVVFLPELAVDANRDGIIKLPSEDATDTTSAANPYRFWLNDDDDGTESFGSSDDSDRVPVQQADWTNHLIDCARDLEDFARLQIYTAGLNDALKNGDLHLGLKWTAVTGTPAIKLYKHVEAGGGTGYLTDQAIAHREYAQRGVANNLPLNDASGQHSDYLVEGAATFVLPPDLFADITETQPKTHLLFEGCKAGKGYLKLVILKKDDANYTEIGEGPSVWVELRSIKSMYQGPGTTFEQPAGETAQGIIFVHGWNMSPEGSVSFAETMFKRLWHRGFKGRYVSLRWNTNYSDAFDHLPVIGAAVDGYLADYNGSERVAWQSGAIVKAAVDGLPFGYSRNIVAHSMGNIIAGSALLAGVTFDNYVLMQAAVPASCYDDRALLQQAERPSPHTYLGFRPTFWEVDASPDDDPVPETRALSYRGRLGGDRGNLVSFYLP
ncbi:MAG: thrombospondin type 3 repeat-containing protein, partial [Candidatus Didemnitutus sp.]|nr:thrombospondin type 3 repeat-containing protein [Candidatus Didemnitutus sp.]